GDDQHHGQHAQFGAQNGQQARAGAAGQRIGDDHRDRGPGNKGKQQAGQHIGQDDARVDHDRLLSRSKPRRRALGKMSR
ncbi:hypothetical protein HMPREF0175_1530, partial [Bifidobacterium longum subsp. longum ATCC 55813]